jgi:hypothetical protein
VIYLGIVSGIFIGSWEIVNNIPKYELIESDNYGMLIINKINGNVYIDNAYDNEQYERYGYANYNLMGKISETPLKKQNEKIK